MTPDRTQLEAYVDAAADLAGIAIDPAHRAAVVASFAMAAGMAEQVRSFGLDEAMDEPAPIFHAGEAP